MTVAAQAEPIRESPLASRALLAVVVVLFVAQQVLLWRLYYGYGAKQLVGDETRYWSVAHDILAGAPWHPSDTWPPAQPLFIALILLAANSLAAVQIVQTLLFLGCGALLFALWRRLSGNTTAAAIAATLFVLAPSDAAYAQYLWPEVPHLFALLVAFALLLARRPVRVPAAIAAGVAVGLALLFKSLVTAFWPLLLACFVERWRPLRLRVAAAAAFVLALLVTIAPALIAGHRNTGHWRIADSSAINLLIGLRVPDRNDYIMFPGWNLFQDYMASGSSAEERNAWAWREIRADLQQSSLAQVAWRQFSKQYFRLFESKTPLLSQLPGPACAGYISAYPDTPRWLALTVRWTSHAFQTLILAGFAFGLFLRRDWRRLGYWLLLGFVAYQLALYLGLLAIARYLLPMVPVFCGFAGEALATLVTGNASQGFSRPRLVAGASLAALLLMLAFAAPWLDGYCRP